MKRGLGIAVLWFGVASGAFAQLSFIFEATFEDETVGKPPRDWKLTNVGKIEVVKSGDREHGNVVRFVDTGEGAGMAREFPVQKTNVISIEYDIFKFVGTGGDTELLYVSNDRLGDLTGVSHPMVTSMREHKGWLYVGGILNNRIGRYRVPGADPDWTGPISYWGERP